MKVIETYIVYMDDTNTYVKMYKTEMNFLFIENADGSLTLVSKDMQSNMIFLNTASV